jgi:hypothetical protein
MDKEVVKAMGKKRSRDLQGELGLKKTRVSNEDENLPLITENDTKQRWDCTLRLGCNDRKIVFSAFFYLFEESKLKMTTIAYHLLLHVRAQGMDNENGVATKWTRKGKLKDVKDKRKAFEKLWNAGQLQVYSISE